MLCSKLHCQKFLTLKSFSYKIFDAAFAVCPVLCLNLFKISRRSWYTSGGRTQRSQRPSSTNSASNSARRLISQVYFIRTSIYDKYSGSMEITTYLDHLRYCQASSGTNWWTRWTYREFRRLISQVNLSAIRGQPSVR